MNWNEIGTGVIKCCRPFVENCGKLWQNQENSEIIIETEEKNSIEKNVINYKIIQQKRDQIVNLFAMNALENDDRFNCCDWRLYSINRSMIQSI